MSIFQETTSSKANMFISPIKSTRDDFAFHLFKMILPIRGSYPAYIHLGFGRIQKFFVSQHFKGYDFCEK